MSIDVEGAKQKYLSQWKHCDGKTITAVDYRLVCECGASFPWKNALGEDVALALDLEWLTPNAPTKTESEIQPGLFA